MPMDILVVQLMSALVTVTALLNIGISAMGFAAQSSPLYAILLVFVLTAAGGVFASAAVNFEFDIAVVYWR